jgi:hypothetical protein
MLRDSLYVLTLAHGHIILVFEDSEEARGGGVGCPGSAYSVTSLKAVDPQLCVPGVYAKS